MVSAKAFLILDFYLLTNNSCDNSLSYFFGVFCFVLFFVILNVLSVLFFVADFNLLACVFVSLTLAS